MTARRQKPPRPATRSKAGGGHASDAPTTGDPAILPSRATAWKSPQTLGIALALALLTIAAFAAVRHHAFILVDDPEYVTDNPHVTGGLSWSGVIWAFTTGHASNWHPLTWLSHMLDVQLFGVRPGAHHVMNLAFHVAGTLLLFAFLVRTTGAIGRSACAAALFAVHPLHVESVAWIAERKDVLSGALWWVTLIAYAAYVTRPSRARYLGVTLAFAAGLMAKPMLVTLPAILLLLDVWPLRRVPAHWPARSDRTRWFSLIREKVPLFAMAVASCVITYLVQLRGGAVKGLEEYSLALRVENALVAMVEYAGKAIWPTRLGIYYPHPLHFPFWQPAGAALLIAGASVFAVRVAGRAPYVTVGWFWYLITLVPVIGLVQVGVQAMADRYTYVPFVGLFIIVAWGAPDLLARLPAARRLLPATAVALILACAIATHAQVAYWQDSVTLLRHTVDATANLNNYGAHHALGMALRDSGRVDESIDEFRETVRLDPHFAAAQNNLAQGLLGRGRAAEALPALLTLARLLPNDAGVERDLGFALAQAGHPDEAVAHLTASLRLQPNQTDVRRNLASTLARLGHTDDAMKMLIDLARDEPGDAEVHNDLGRMFADLGRASDARVHFAEATRLKPDLADAHANLGLALAVDGHIPEGIAEISEAIRLDPGHAGAHCNLGLVLEEQGRLPDAIAQFAEAVRIAPGLERARVGYGNALALASRFDEAVVQFQAALRINPNNALARKALEQLAKRGK